ncbi:VPS35 endosomal protein-sorting factor-like isoform X2 [Ornithodoros turicata]|uniref:VPS35 endosomal protein-sorting factor-like isoform X2 n=1 Tax=Ornithodoros turicata TaxID=34597 RepID=UPI003138DD15
MAWQTRLKNYDAERKERSSVPEEVSDHPLRVNIITIQDGRTKRCAGTSSSSASSSASGTPRRTSSSWGGLDSLSSLHPLSSALEGLDPLTMMSAEETVDKNESSITKSASLEESFEPWAIKKSGILARYSTSEKLSITTSFLSGGEKVVVKAQGSVSDKVKNRLEQLDDFEEGSVKEMLNLSQQEYIIRIEELNQALKEAWEQDQKVKALKIAIQCSKLLVDTSVIQFYPSKFVLITDILDNFGDLVYQRIHSKAEYIRPGTRVAVPLPENFTPDQVPESAKETCRNWFFKIASVRELIPRFYVETAILRSYSFLTQKEYSRALMRLTRVICGIGDPLVAAYARCYLCRVGMSVAPQVREHVLENFWDFLLTYPQIQRPLVQTTLAQQHMNMATYLTLYCPALDWVLQCGSYRAPESILTQVLAKCKLQCHSGLLLNSIMTAFKPEFIARRALEFVTIMKDCDDSAFPKHILFRTLGLCLIVSDPPEDHKLQVLNEVWKIVSKLRCPVEYMSCAEVWIEYPCKHFSKREINTFLGSVIKQLTPDRAFEGHYAQLATIVNRILAHVHDFSALFSMENFLPFLDLLQKESSKVDVCKNIMESFLKHQKEPTHDPVIVNALMYICKAMHNSVDALTLEDEKRQIGALICGFLHCVSFGRDFEQQLSFYVDARAAFSTLDAVLMQLVQACAAYCFITIPSLDSVLNRLELCLLSGQVALLNQCLSQADASFKAAISLLPEMPNTIELEGKHRSTEPFLLSYINNFLSTLLYVPDNPEHEPLYLLRGLLNVVQDYVWDSHCDSRALVYLNVMNLLSAMIQDSYLYHVDKVDSNDTLYGGDPKFTNEVNELCQTVLDELLCHLKQLGDSGQYKRQAVLALELLYRIVINGDLHSRQLMGLCINLWNLAHRHATVDHRMSVRCIEFIKQKGTKPKGKPFAELASKLQIPSTV